MDRKSSKLITTFASGSSTLLGQFKNSGTPKTLIAEQPETEDSSSTNASDSSAMLRHETGFLRHGVSIAKLFSDKSVQSRFEYSSNPNTTDLSPPSDRLEYDVVRPSFIKLRSTQAAPELLRGLRKWEQREGEMSDAKRLVKAKIISEGRHTSSKNRLGPKRELLHTQTRLLSARGTRSFMTSACYFQLSGSPELASAESNIPIHPSDATNSTRPSRLTIRESLRVWEAENSDSKAHDVLKNEFTKAIQEGQVSNALTRPMDADAFDCFDGEDISFGNQPLFEIGDLLDFGDQRSFFLRGDLVELRASAGGLRSELGIFVREFHHQAQFYTMSGKWINCKAGVVKFFVPNFVEAQELNDLLPFLPDEDVGESLQDKLQGFESQLPRNIGAPLVEKMLDFWKESDTAYRKAAFKLDNAHRLVAQESTLRYATLVELAEELVPNDMKTSEGLFPPHVLFAVHRSLMQDDVGFRSQRLGNHRVWGSLEITSLNETIIIKNMCEIVRKYQEWIILKSQGIDGGKLDGFLMFLTTARRLIQRSRAVREVTWHGIIGPAKSESSVPTATKTDHIEECFAGGDNIFIRFMEAWCGLRIINSTSTVNGIASTILRATGMYDEFVLDQSTGWIFLQEIGAIAPWANRVAFDARLPGTGRKLQADGKKDLRVVDLRKDVLEGHRKDWGEVPVYCIDNATAREIDDGISVEETEIPGETWLHIHVADPGSQFSPDSQVGKIAQRKVQTVYFPERVIPMLPLHIVEERFSLARNRPVLTFSAKMNVDGDILEHRVTAGTIHNVINMTYEVLREVLGRGSTPAEISYRVGNGTMPVHNIRKMVSAAEILNNPIHKRNLESLYQLSDSFRIALAKRGAVDPQQEDASLSVTFPKELNVMMEPQKWKVSTSYCFYEDPTIELIAPISGSEDTIVASVVKEAMTIAGHVAARWCHERGIPIIYRVSQKHPDKPDPMILFRKEILPQLSPTTRLPSRILEKYIRELGRVLPSTTAAPHLWVGLDMYTKATSPLRRYTDLLVQWQIEAALLEEAKTGVSLIGSTREDYLPFTKADIDAMIPRLDGREKEIADAHRSANRTWVLQLLIRAWKFGEATLPETFEFIIRSVKLDGRISGSIPILGNFAAVFQSPKWLSPSDLREGDIIEVKIQDLNSYTRRAYVTALRQISRAADVVTE